MNRESDARRRRERAAERYRPEQVDTLPYLDELRDRGWFVLHMSTDPFGDRSVLAPLLPSLIRRCTVIRPKRILLVGAPLYDLAYEPLATAGLPVEDARIPFPGSGQQRRFLDTMRDLV